MRLDVHLVESGVYESRARARAAIEAGLVRVNGTVATKPSRKISEDDDVAAAGEAYVYVSRGGVKLAAALQAMKIDPAGKVCLDLGASTGGFTDVLLRAGAAKVYGVDVGRDQLHPSLRDDPRVVNLEQTHAKDLSPSLLPEPVDVIVCDVSFISLRKALPPTLELAAPGARLAALIKPQFEVGRAQLGKGGIVKPGEANSIGVVSGIETWLNGLPGWKTTGWTESPIAGGDGNREFLIGAVKQG